MLDLSGLGGAITSAITQSLNAIQNSLNNLVNKPAAAPYDIAGLREQILGKPHHVSGLALLKLTVCSGNARVLYPATQTKRSSLPNLRVVTRAVQSEDPGVSAHVLHISTDALVPRIVLISGEQASCAGEALEKLLDLTERMVDVTWSACDHGETYEWTEIGDGSGFSSFKHLLYDGT